MTLDDAAFESALIGSNGDDSEIVPQFVRESYKLNVLGVIVDRFTVRVGTVQAKRLSGIV
jgi:hypothetical protein